MNSKLIRITTIPLSLKLLLKGQMHFMSDNGFDVIGVSSPEKELQEVAEYEKIKTIPVKMTRVISPFTDLHSLWKLYKIFKKQKPHIVHTHTPKAGTIGMLAAKMANVPIRMHTVAGLPLLETTGKKRKLLDAVEKLTYGAATKVYPNSYALKNIILKEGYTKQEKLKVIGKGSTNGIDTTHFSPAHFSKEQKMELRDSLGLHQDDFVFIFVGRLVGDKGIHELVAAFSKFKIQNSKLLLVGPFEKDLDPILPETEVEIENNPNILSVGYQQDVRPYFAISDCLAFPSYREGFPNVVMQAGAMELPAVVTDINGCNEIIEEGKNGLIIPPKNEEALYHAMEKIRTDKALYLHLKSNAREMITTRYEQQYVWNELLKEYRQLEKEYNMKRNK